MELFRRHNPVCFREVFLLVRMGSDLATFQEDRLVLKLHVSLILFPALPSKHDCGMLSAIPMD